MFGIKTRPGTRNTPTQRLAPCGFDAGDGDLYRYVGNDPTNATDPSGLDTDPDVGPGQVVSSGKIIDLDVAYDDTPFKDMAAVAQKFTANKNKRQLTDWNITPPTEFAEAGPFTATNKEVNEKNFKLPAGAFTYGGILFFVRFDIPDAGDDLGIRVSEITDLRDGGKGKGPVPAATNMPEKGSTWTIGKLKKANGKYSASIVYVDAPSYIALDKPIKQDEAGNDEDLVPMNHEDSIIQIVEVINTKTQQALAHKLILVKVNIDQTGKLDTGFLSEDSAAYKKADQYFTEKYNLK